MLHHRLRLTIVILLNSLDGYAVPDALGKYETLFEGKNL